MKRIYLFCSAGMSTSLLVTKMRKAAEEVNLPVYIEAFSIAKLDEKGPEADCILLGPQVRYEFDKVKERYSDRPVGVLDSNAYGMMDGLASLKQAVRTIKSFKKVE